MQNSYRDNFNLKPAGVKIPYTEEQLQEYIKCTQDPLYFIANYCKVVSLDKGVVNFIPYPYQERIINTMHNNNNTIAKLFRQGGKSTIVAAYFAWCVLFNDNKTAAILANKQVVAVEIFNRVQFIIENLPKWLQQGVVEWNKKSLVLENGSRCIAASTSASAIRGLSVNYLLLDEFAHLGHHIAEDFIQSVFPTLSSSKTAKMVIISTPNGLNHYYKIWKDACNKINDFAVVEGNWRENPERDQKWADEQKKKLKEVGYRQEIECLWGESLITIRDKFTGEIKQVTMKELYSLCE